MGIEKCAGEIGTGATTGTTFHGCQKSGEPPGLRSQHTRLKRAMLYRMS